MNKKIIVVAEQGASTTLDEIQTNPRLYIKNTLSKEFGTVPGTEIDTMLEQDPALEIPSDTSGNDLLALVERQLIYSRFFCSTYQKAISIEAENPITQIEIIGQLAHFPTLETHSNKLMDDAITNALVAIKAFWENDADDLQELDTTAVSTVGKIIETLAKIPRWHDRLSQILNNPLSYGLMDDADLESDKKLDTLSDKILGTSNIKNGIIIIELRLSYLFAAAKGVGITNIDSAQIYLDECFRLLYLDEILEKTAQNFLGTIDISIAVGSCSHLMQNQDILNQVIQTAEVFTTNNTKKHLIAYERNPSYYSSDRLLIRIATYLFNKNRYSQSVSLIIKMKDHFADDSYLDILEKLMLHYLQDSLTSNKKIINKLNNIIKEAADRKFTNKIAKILVNIGDFYHQENIKNKANIYYNLAWKNRDSLSPDQVLDIFGNISRDNRGPINIRTTIGALVTQADTSGLRGIRLEASTGYTYLSVIYNHSLQKNYNLAIEIIKKLQELKDDYLVTRAYQEMIFAAIRTKDFQKISTFLGEIPDTGSHKSKAEADTFIKMTEAWGYQVATDNTVINPMHMSTNAKIKFLGIISQTEEQQLLAIGLLQNILHGEIVNNYHFKSILALVNNYLALSTAEFIPVLLFDAAYRNGFGFLTIDTNGRILLEELRANISELQKPTT